MSGGNIVASVLVILGMLVIYEKFSRHDRRLSESKFYKQFLVGKSDTQNVDVEKPMLWIHVTHDQNARWWKSFYSRNSEFLNQPYLFLTMNSTITKNAPDFNVAVIDDDSFSALIPGWTHDLTKVSDSVRSHIRLVALTKLLSLYGGMLVPPGFACGRPLIQLYREGITGADMFVCENHAESVIADSNVFFPSVKFMGCATKSQSMMKLNDYIVKTVAASHTDEIEFTGKINMFCHKMVLGREANVISGKSTGVRKEDGSAVSIEDLFGTSNVALHSGTYGLWIPHEKILSRVKYGYFPRMSSDQVMKSGEFVSRAVTAAGS